MIMTILANSGYLIGIGIEAVVIVVFGVLLVLMLTGLLFKWLANYNESKLVKAEARAAAAEARAVVEEELAAQAAAEAEAARAQAEYEARVKAEAETAAAEAAAVAAARKAEEEAKVQRLKVVEQKPAPEVVEQPAAVAQSATTEQTAREVVTERIVEKVVIVEQQKAEPQPAPQQVIEEAAAADATEEEPDGENGFVVVQDGIVFNDSKTITELYEELSPEQQSYFDELREEALTKPDTELAIAKNFVTVKIGKRNLIKLLIKRGVTVAEFMLENEALKQLRLSNTNKRGKSSIKVKPTVVQVLDLASLKVAVDMINLSYEEIMMD
ncbi:MAG: hypothetical protein NC033_04910 [Clostridiales bacterium]|nr:hypothetical protein [Clostridiales bacterium]